MSENILKEYVANLSDDDLKYLESRLNQRFSGDVAEVLNFVERNSKIDSVLSKTKTADDLYDAIDLLQKLAGKEIESRPQLTDA